MALAKAISARACSDPFVLTPVFYFPDFLNLVCRGATPFTCSILQSSSSASDPRISPTPLCLIVVYGGCEITMGEGDDPRDEQITDEHCAAP